MNKAVLRIGRPGEIGGNRKPGLNMMLRRTMVCKMMQKMYEPELMRHMSMDVYTVCSPKGGRGLVYADYWEISTPQYHGTRGLNTFNPVGWDGMGVRNIYTLKG